ncbi:TrkH family potassium uptake protein [Oceanirhabdus sp. W0125-5]|uniref:TrkH family potassium uptake protein n=1 Tax=Oceanirhabdus sp. W0125-5 TaxID=2999116 RepID=UPI0022F2CBFA|nr:TrkH family potassium uptake protein [Oceanirhabdus sp. W0125-5]WBW99406.1 TrkH family potassium uptake protein [Oceanirhabdus sp. W0125-5]
MRTTFNSKKIKNKLTPVQILAGGFFVLIIIGAILLTLPIATVDRVSTNFIDALFTSTSAVCVTGLVVVDTGTYWSMFGKTVIITLIEIGGLGFMSVATLFFLLLGKRITLRERMVMQEAMNYFSLQGLVKMAKYILIFTFSVQLAGAAILSIQFIPEYGPLKGIGYSLFHSISAFCNAGFDLMGNFTSITKYSGNPLVMLTITSLIIISGLGFFVWADIYNYKKSKRLTLHSKIVITMTVILVIGGAILMFLFENSNPDTIQNVSTGEKILSSLFASVTPRTAGFNSISTDAMTNAGKFLTMILMFIGGSPGSTAGGIKTVTAGVLILTLIAFIKGKEDVEAFGRRINRDTVFKAFVIVLISLLLVIVSTLLLSVTEPNTNFELIFYEAISAFGTVGLSMGLTPNLSLGGKIIVAIAMYCGRVGPLTVALALGNKKRKGAIRYPEDKILVG